MGHLCSCHRQQKFDKGKFTSNIVWKSDPSLLCKLRLRRSGQLSATGLETLPRAQSPSDGLHANATVRQRGKSHSATNGSAAVATATRPVSQTVVAAAAAAAAAAPAAAVTHPSSSPSSPTLNRAPPPPKPPRMRSLLVSDDGRFVGENQDDDRNDVTTLLVGELSNDNTCRRPMSLSAVDVESLGTAAVAWPALSPSAGNEGVNSGSGRALATADWSTNLLPGRHNSTTVLQSSPFDGVTTMLTSRAVELIVASDLQPEVIVDYLRRRDVVNDETVAAVRRCATRRSAYELIVEVVVNKGYTEMESLVEALKVAGSDHIANCLQAVSGLLTLRLLDCDDNDTHNSSGQTCCNNIRLDHAFKCVCDASCIDATNANRRLSFAGCVTAKFDVDIVYVDSVSGLITGTEPLSRQASDATYAARTNGQRYRSMIIDPETVSLQALFRTFANNVNVTATDDIVGSSVKGIPVVSLSLTGICLSEWLTDKIIEALFCYPCLRVLSLVKCHRTRPCLERLRHVTEERKSGVIGAECRLMRLEIRLSDDAICGASNDNDNDRCLITDLACVAWRWLRSLCLAGSGMTSSECSALFRHLVAGSRLLTDLDISFNDVADVRPIADALSDNCSLRRIRLRGNAIGAEGAMLIFDSLRRNYRLEHLDIGGNSFGSAAVSGGRFRATTPLVAAFDETRSPSTPSGQQPNELRLRPADSVAQSLAEALVCNRALRELHVERCGFAVDECRGIARGLLTNATLTNLDLSANPSIGDAGMALIADSLRRNGRCCVETLSMNMCSISDVGLRFLLCAIASGGDCGAAAVANGRATGGRKVGRTQLKRIKLCYNNIGTADRASSTRRRIKQPSFGGRRCASMANAPPLPRYDAVFASSPLRSGGSSPVIGADVAATVGSALRSCESCDTRAETGGRSGADKKRDWMRNASSCEPTAVTGVALVAGRLPRAGSLVATTTSEDLLIRRRTEENIATESDCKYSRLRSSCGESELSHRNASASLIVDAATGHCSETAAAAAAAVTAASDDGEVSILGSRAPNRPNSLNTSVVSKRNPDPASATFARGQHVYHSHRHLSHLRESPADFDGQVFRCASAVVTCSEEAPHTFGCESAVSTNRYSATSLLNTSLPETCDGIESDDCSDIYRLLCDVLVANPGLKILLWGNGRTNANENSSAGGGGRKVFADVQEEDVDQCDVDGDELTNNEDSLDKATHVPETVLSSREMKLGAEDEFSSLPCRRQKFQGTTGVNNNHMVAAAGGWKYATLPYRSAEPRNFMNSVFQ